MGSLLKSLPGIKKKYINIGSPNSFGVGYHMPAELLDENGNFKEEGDSSFVSRLIKSISSKSVFIANNIFNINMENASDGIGKFIDEMMAEGNDAEVSWNKLINNEDVKEYLYVASGVFYYDTFLNNLELRQNNEFNELVNKYNEGISEIKELITNGKYLQALYEICNIVDGSIIIECVSKGIFDKVNTVLDFGKSFSKMVIDGLCKWTENNKYITLDKKFKWKSIKHLFGWLDKSYRQASASVRYISDPLVIDLDGDGFELTDVENGVYFDNDNYGLSEKTQWVSSDDGLLAIDLNGDGIIMMDQNCLEVQL